ncbi:GrpB family protein [Chitinophaga skermanii]|nr:GrpB family protein [Chitinophaga skermanii]
MKVEIVPYQEEWPLQFQALGKQLKAALGTYAVAIHHIGSTSIPGLQAKAIIDIQVTVDTLHPNIAERLAEAGALISPVNLSDHRPPGTDIPNEELQKMFFRYAEPRANIHVRENGRFNQRYALLIRDYLRQHPRVANAYGEFKVRLSRAFPNDPDGYVDIKDPVFDIIMEGANAWAKESGWKVPGSDI